MDRFIGKHLLHVALLFALLLMFATASSHRAQAYETNEIPHARVVLAQATAETTETPSATETVSPTDAPTVTETPSDTPTDSPTDVPTDAPTDISTDTPTEEPTALPTDEPTIVPTDLPTETSTAFVTETPSTTETVIATETVVSDTPTSFPTETETSLPTETPTLEPKESPTPAPTDETEIVVEPDQAAEFQVDDGNLIVAFPKGAVNRRVRVTYERVEGDDPVQDPQHRRVLARFRLNAYRVSNDRPLEKFDQPLQITLRYDPAILSGWDEGDLQMVYWDEKLVRWMPLKSFVDPKTQVVIAETDHFTDFGLANAPDVQSYLPNLEGFQTDLFSGAAGYSYGLQVPPGRGGLAPRLALSYSSASVDNLNSDLQVSYIGAGWGMDTGYVARNTRNTFQTGDDFYSIVLNGAGYDLVLGSDGAYHTSKEQYWKITFANNEWTVITSDGTTYTFGTKANSRAVEWRSDGAGNIAKDTYNWWLDKVLDVHGSEIVYAYKHEQGSNGQACGNTPSPFDNAVYPETIQYNKSGSSYLTQLTFLYTARTDYHYVYPARQCGNAPVQLSKLDAIEIKTTDNVGALALVRRYEFKYDYSTFPGVYNDGTSSYGRLTLKRIKHFGTDATTKLPDTVFTYANNRLSVGENGIGGKVTFAYEGSAADAGPFGDKYDQDYNTWNLGGCIPSCNVPVYAFWKPFTSGYTWTNADPLGKKAIKWTTGNSTSRLFWWVDPFTPGASYVMTNTLVANTTGQIQFRSWDGTTESNLTNWLNVTANTGKTVVTNFDIPDGAKAPEIRLYTNFAAGKLVYMEHTILQPRASHHRVASKTVEDGIDSASNTTYTYAYTGIASNDAAHSVAATTSEPRHEPGSQFRGHAQVTVTDPNGNVSETWFKQDDSYAGKTYKAIQRDGAGNQYFVTDNTFEKTAYGVAAYPSPNPVTGDTIEFIKLTETIVSKYDGNNSAPPLINKTTYGYDSKGNVSVTSEFGNLAAPYRSTQREYYFNTTANILNKVARQYVTNASGTRIAETQYFYDGNTLYTQTPTKGDLTKTVVYTGTNQFFTSATFQYNPTNGNLTEVWDALGNNTHTDYETTYQIFPTSVRNAKLQTATSQYNFRLGKPEVVTDANGAATRTEFDVFGRALKIFAPGEASSTNPTAQYDYFMGDTGVPSRVHVQVRSDLGGANPAAYQHAWWLFDGRGRLIQKQAQGLNGQTLLANTRYNNLGQAYRASNPYAISGYDPLTNPQYQTPDWNQPYTQNTFDPIGRVTRTDSPGIPAPTLMAYDHQWMTVTDANGHTKDSFTDGFGRVTQIIEHNLGATYTTQYGYETLDRLVDTYDSANNNTHLTYDWLGRKLTMTDPDMGTWGYEYDNAGNLKRQSDARGNSVCFGYDELNRATEKKARQSVANCTGGTVAYTVNYFYDDTTNGNKGIGRRTSMTDPTGNTQFVYDLIGRVMTTTQTIDTSSYTTIVTSDAMGRARSTKYPDNETVNQTYNAQGLPATLINADALPFTYIAGANYNAASQMTTLTFGNNVVTTYGYNAQNLRLMTLQTGAGNTIQNLSYGYDNVGNVTNLTDILNSKTSNYTYDDLNRLTTWELVANYSQSWQYNPIGNLTQRVDISAPQNFEYTDPAHKHAVTKHNGVTQFVYDANGNMIQRYSDLMQYDVENRLTSTTIGSTTTTNYYNGDGARVKKVITTGGTPITTYYIGGIYEYTTWTGGTSIAKYYYFGGQRVAVKNSSGVSYIHGDHLGSTSATSGAVASNQTFYPFGAIFSSSGTPPTDYGFTGQKRDASANLMYYGARYYDPGLGRFTQPDTIVPNAMDPQSLNRYSYVRNNPVNRVDPTGHEDCAAEDDWCWQNRWYEAHGYCWSDRADDWTRQCQPDFQDADILEEVLGEADGLGIVLRANAFQVIGLLVNATLENPDLAKLLPNLFMLGGQVSPGIGVLGFTGYVQMVIDFKHYQVGFFWGFGIGLSAGITPASIGVGPEAGLGLCTETCRSLYEYTGLGLSLGASAYAETGGGFDFNFSANPLSFAGYTIPFPNGKILLLSGTVGAGVAGEVHALGTFTLPIGQIKTYPTLQSFQVDLYKYTVLFTGNPSLAQGIVSYAGIVPYEEPNQQ